MHAVAQSVTSQANVDCYSVVDSRKHALLGGTKVFVRTRMVLVQRNGESAKEHVLADSGAINGTVENGEMRFDSRKVTLDAGVPIRFSVEQEICAVPSTSTIPGFLKDTRFYIAP